MGSLHTHIHGICEIFVLYHREEHMEEDRQVGRDGGSEGITQLTSNRERCRVGREGRMDKLTFRFLCPEGICARTSGC